MKTFLAFSIGLAIGLGAGYSMGETFTLDQVTAQSCDYYFATADETLDVLERYPDCYQVWRANRKASAP